MLHYFQLTWRRIALILGIGIALFGLARLVIDVILRPLDIYMRLKAQGVKGPSFIPIVGNRREYMQLLAEAHSTPMNPFSHEIVPHVHPFYTKWSKLYGEPFMYTYGPDVRLVTADPELMKEVLSTKFGYFSKQPMTPPVRYLFGDGLITSRDEKWVRDRRILNPAFHIDKLKAMVPITADLATNMCNDWEGRMIHGDPNKGDWEVEVEVLSEYKTLTADVIARTAFGTNYEEGKTVFSLQYEQQKIAAESRLSFSFPGKGILPTKKNLHQWKIRKTIHKNLKNMVLKRMQMKFQANLDTNYQQNNDLLDIMVSAYQNSQLQGGDDKKKLRMEIEDIVDQCKTFFFAGHETTATLLAWTTMLLALHPYWQDKVRREIFNICGKSGHPNNDMLGQLKQLGMVVNEALRLYPIALEIRRIPEQDIQIGHNMMNIPKGTIVCLMLGVMMHNTQVWGDDADEFNPERFSEGPAKACSHGKWAFMPFSIGPRNCIGQVFALMEAKVVLCKLLQRLSFHISPAYVHEPKDFMVLTPMHGMKILVKPLDS